MRQLHTPTYSFLEFHAHPQSVERGIYRDQRRQRKTQIDFAIRASRILNDQTSGLVSLPIDMMPWSVVFRKIVKREFASRLPLLVP